MKSYTIEEHRHRFSAWAAARGASVVGCRFTVEQAKGIIESIGLHNLLIDPEFLPPPDKVDEVHRKWRCDMIEAAQNLGLNFTHGVAAKLINIYLKSGFVCGGCHNDDRVRALHPPIDSVLLAELSARDVGGLRSEWNKARKIRWSKFDSTQYESVIDSIRQSLPNTAMWEIEKYWRDYQ